MSWLADAFADLRQRIQNRWTDDFHGDPHEPKEKPYILDELFRPSTWLALILYAVSMFLIIWLFYPPEWFVILLGVGYAVLGQALIKDKWFTSSWTRQEKRTDKDE